MIDFIVTFSLAAAGSLVCLSAGLVLHLAAGTGQRSTLISGAGRGESTEAPRPVDPVATVAFILVCYGLIALVLSTALPGPLALERTGLTFALLCVGGLIGEISSSASTGRLPEPDEQRVSARRKPMSLCLSLALMLVLDLGVAVLTQGQGLIQIVPPPKPVTANRIQELEPMFVVARRTRDPLEDRAATF